MDRGPAPPCFTHSVYTGPSAQLVDRFANSHMLPTTQHHMTGPVMQPVLHLGTNEVVMLTALTAAMNRLAAAIEGQNARQNKPSGTV